MNKLSTSYVYCGLGFSNLACNLPEHVLCVHFSQNPTLFQICLMNTFNYFQTKPHVHYIKVDVCEIIIFIDFKAQDLLSLTLPTHYMSNTVTRS